MSLGLALKLANAPLFKGVGVDARYGIDIFAARSVGQTRFRNGLRSSSSLTDIATVTRATTAWGVDQAGLLSSFAAGAPVVNTAGLAVWEARTNVLTYSQDFTQAAWVKQGSAAALGGQFTAPDSTLTGSTVAAGATDSSAIRQNITATGQRYTKTLYVGAGLSSRVLLGIYDATAGVFVPVTARIVSGPGALSGSTLIWLQGLSATALTRVELSSNAALTGSHHVYIYPDSDNSGGSQTVGNTIRLWGVQLEPGASSTPYIPTTSAPVIRNADAITETVNIPVGQAFTVTGKVIAPQLGGIAGAYPNIIDLGDVPSGSVSNRIYMYFSSSAVGIGFISSGGSTGGSTAGSWVAGAPVGFAVSVVGNKVSLSVNNAAVVSMTMANGPFAAPLICAKIGSLIGGGSYLNSTIRDLNIVMRAYSAAELQAASDVSLVWDEDFTTQTYRYVGDPYAAITDLPLTTFTRATTKYAANSAGVLVPFGVGVPAITDAGLSVEAAASNLLQNSGLAGGATPTNWDVGFETGTGSVGTSAVIPSNANRTCTVGVGNRQFIQQTISLAANTTYTVSIDVEAVSGAADGFFAYASGLPAGASATPISAPTSTGRKTFTITVGATAGSALIRVGLGTSTAVTVAGSVTWSNPQVEAGTVATSRITTPVGGTATRNADVLVTADSVISPTIFAEVAVPANGGATPFPWAWGWDDGTGNNRAMLVLDRSTLNLRLQIDTGGVAQAYVDLGTLVAGSTYKIAARLAANDVAVSKNGAAVVTDTSVTLPVVSTFRRGRGPSGNEWGPGIRKIKRYSTAKTNAELQALSA